MSENSVKLDLPPALVCSTTSSLTSPSPSTSTTSAFDRDDRLARYAYAERKAILDHRFFLSIELQREATFDETIRSWEAGVCIPWRREKMRRDRIAQIKEIERHKYYLSMQCGYDIGAEAAASDWIHHHAAPWREWWEHHWWERQWWERETEAEAQKRPMTQTP